MAGCLSISLVIFHPDETLLEKTLESLFLAANKAKSMKCIDDFHLIIVDNSLITESNLTFADSALFRLIKAIWTERIDLLQSPVNLGYGAGHNQAIKKRCAHYHLVINPDVIVAEDALVEAVHYLQRQPQVGLVTPLCFRPDGQQEYLCKAYPSVMVLLLRGFAPKWLKQYFQAQLAAYELSHQDNNIRNDVLIASGCFMFFRQQAIQAVNGFCEQFFLYFEDFDLSLRLLPSWQIAFVPQVRIIHHGGHSAKKGLKHISLFIRSAGLFFNRHGWRFW